MGDVGERGAAARRFHELSTYRRDDGVEDGLAIGVPPELEPAIWQRDWSIEPHPFKEYETLPPIELPSEWPRAERPAWRVLGLGSDPGVGGTAAVDRAALARIAQHTAGLLNRAVPRRDGTVHQFRAAGGTGARYHLELYVVCGDLADLAAGVYHYAAYDHTFRQVRAGDFREVLVEASGEEPAVAEAPAVCVLTSTFWRNAWRYRERAYRHTFWDAGTTLSQLLAVAGSAGLPAEVVLGYADAKVNALLDVDGVHEAAVALAPVGAGADRATRTPKTPTLGLPVRPVSAWQQGFDEIARIQAATVLPSGAEAAEWRRNRPPERDSAPTGELVPLSAYDETVTLLDVPDAPTVEELVRGRRSVRHYDANWPTSFAAFSALLRASAAGFAADCLGAGAVPYELFLIVNSVEGLEPGLYLHHPARDAVELLRAGDFRADAQRVAVDQEYTARAHVNLYYLGDLDALLAAYGDRGYRIAQLAGALDAGRLHLSTHLLGCGAVGSTSADEEVIELFGPRAEGLSYLFVTVFGKRRPPRATA